MVRPIVLVAAVAVAIAVTSGLFVIQSTSSNSVTNTSTVTYPPSTSTTYHTAPNSGGLSTQNGITTKTQFITETITDQGVTNATIISCSQTGYVTVTLTRVVTNSATTTAPQTTVTTTSTLTIHQPETTATITVTNCSSTISTITTTVTASLGSPTVHGTVVTNGTTSLEFLGSGLNGTTLIFPVTNLGVTSFGLSSVIVNGVAGYPLTMNPNPLPVNASASIEIVLPSLANCPGSCDFHVTFVTNQGVELSYYTYFVGGISTTKKTSK